MDYSELFEGARKQISIIPDEQIFLAKDLFKMCIRDRLKESEFICKKVHILNKIKEDKLWQQSLR